MDLSHAQVMGLVRRHGQPEAAGRAIFRHALAAWREMGAADNLAVVVVAFDWGAGGALSAASFGSRTGGLRWHPLPSHAWPALLGTCSWGVPVLGRTSARLGGSTCALARRQRDTYGLGFWEPSADLSCLADSSAVSSSARGAARPSQDSAMSLCPRPNLWAPSSHLAAGPKGLSSPARRHPAAAGEPAQRACLRWCMAMCELHRGGGGARPAERALAGRSTAPHACPAAG